jgi:hypothetical protein
MANRKLQLPNRPYNGRGFGRNINHDPRSLNYRVPPAAKIVSVSHEIHIPILDQGQIGKCVAETGAEVLASDGFWQTLDAELQQALSTVSTAEDWTSALYRELTSSDDYPGQWEPDDTGSDGLTLGKVLKSRGLISGYAHATTVDEAHTGLQNGVIAFGTIFTEGMESPSAEGIVKMTGQVLGGHEYSCYAYDAARDLWWCRNHWTADWGKNGTFAFSTPTLQKLMNQQGDVTIPVPSTQPAPQPSPEPTPAPGVSQPDWAILDPFIDHPRAYTKAARAAQELSRWKNTL